MWALLAGCTGARLQRAGLVVSGKLLLRAVAASCAVTSPAGSENIDSPGFREYSITVRLLWGAITLVLTLAIIATHYFCSQPAWPQEDAPDTVPGTFSRRSVEARINSSIPHWDSPEQRVTAADSNSVAHRLLHRLLPERPDWEIPVSELEFCELADGSFHLLGKGSVGQVYKARRLGVQPVAVKCFAADSVANLDSFQREVAILRSCRDRNVVQFLGAAIMTDQVMLVTEFCEGGDLFHALERDSRKPKTMLTWYKRGPDGPEVGPSGSYVSGLGRRIALDIARGLHFLHSRRVVHMDLKSLNILLVRDYTAKIADVGLARYLTKDYLTSLHMTGTFAWAAPEMLLGARCTEKVDLYSYGVILWEIITMEAPQRGALRAPRVPQECPPAVADLLQACLDANPDSRPSAKEVVEILQSNALAG